MNLNTIKNISSELFQALRAQETVLPLTDRYPEIEINDAYQISRRQYETFVKPSIVADLQTI